MSVIVVAVAVLATAAAAALWLFVLPRLAEPVTAEAKVPYTKLATTRSAVVVGLLSGIAAGLAWSRLPLDVQPLWWVLSTAGVVLAAIDGFTTWIPATTTRWTWAAMLAATLCMPALGADWTDPLRAFAGAAIAGACFGLTWLLTRGALGFGDVRFVPLIGAATAAISWTALLTALLAGCLMVAGHALINHLRGRRGFQPWAPALLLGSYAAALLHR